jgi:AraC family transcriptional regulator, transcriptional activator of pobA
MSGGLKDTILIKDKIVQHSHIKADASLLNTTPQNLNAACRKSNGMSAGEILDAFITDEAKRLLIYTDNKVGEIAYQLNFKDPSHFVKFFKKHQKVTPEQYRKSSFQNYHL